MAVKDDLMAAFAGESQANRKYLAFAKKAEKDGFAKLARLFSAVAEAETIHAHKHFEILGGIGSSADNVKAALEGETYEFTEMYPGFIADAEKEGNQAARISFHGANEAEKAHAKLYQKALEAVQGGKDFPAEGFYLCPVCGYVAEDHAPDKCPICGTAGKMFKAY
ncbi:MAG: rubrerythrin family protein [Firmicutes bacterium]|nr:rubrerythrin family protein [Bacillota bacterium]